MACKSIQTFTYDACESSLGGIKGIWMADYKEGAATVSGDTVTSFEGVEWKYFPIRKNTASMTSSLNVGDGGSYISTELALVFTKMETQKRIGIQSLILGEAMAIIQDSNNHYWFLGMDAPLTCTAGGGETGVDKASRNAYTLTLTDESLELPYEVGASVIETLTKGE